MGKMIFSKFSSLDAASD